MPDAHCHHLRLPSTVFDCLRLAVGVVALAACVDSSGPGPGGDRPYRMGFSAFPPSDDFDLAIQSLELWSPRADAAIMHLSVPWAGLLGGATPDEALEQNGIGLNQYFQSKNLPLR
jgi:hypothetical protein